MKNQSNCKMCGASGKIKAAKSTKWQHGGGKGIMRGTTKGHFHVLKNGESSKCPYCHTNKYTPRVGKKQLAKINASK